VVRVEDLHDPRHREIYRALLEQGDQQALRLSAAAASLYAELKSQSTEEIVDAEGSFEDAVADVRIEELQLRQAYLNDQIRAAGDERREQELAMEKVALKQQLKQLKGRAAMGYRAIARYREPTARRPSPPPTSE
jgi:hypothetical protein